MVNSPDSTSVEDTGLNRWIRSSKSRLVIITSKSLHIDMADQAQVSGNTVNKPMEYAERENVNPQTSLNSFIWQTFLETYYVSGTILGARDTGVSMPGQSPALISLTFWWGTLTDLKENTE